MERILATAHTHHLVVHFHTGYLPEADPLHFDAFLSEYGEAATYQLVHMGKAIAPAFRFVPRFIEWIEKGYDVYTDTSIVPGFAPRWLVGELLAEWIGRRPRSVRYRLALGDLPVRDRQGGGTGRGG